MSSEPNRESRRLWLALSLCSGMLLSVMALVVVRSCHPVWEKYQERFRDLGGSKQESLPGIVQTTACTNEVDRCVTCHRGIDRTDWADPKIPQPFRAHSNPDGHHSFNVFGCSACHGGAGRALDPGEAHQAVEFAEPDPLMRLPHLQASCGRCHVPGEGGTATERLARGANLFLELGCLMCHPLDKAGRGGWDFGPDLRAMGRKSIEYLKASMIDPKANFRESTMPSFAHTFIDDPDSLIDVVIFLESLALPRPDRCNQRYKSEALVAAPCASCHGGEAGKATGRFIHQCVYIKQRQAQLTCSNCHLGPLPPPSGAGERCPVILEHRRACVACHEESATGVWP